MTELAETQFCHLHALQSVTYSLHQIFFHQHSDFSQMCPERKSTNSSLNTDKHVKLTVCVTNNGDNHPPNILPNMPSSYNCIWGGTWKDFNSLVSENFLRGLKKIMNIVLYVWIKYITYRKIHLKKYYAHVNKKSKTWKSHKGITYSGMWCVVRNKFVMTGGWGGGGPAICIVGVNNLWRICLQKNGILLPKHMASHPTRWKSLNK